MGTDQTFEEWVNGKKEEATSFVQTNVLDPIAGISNNTNVLQNPGEAISNGLANLATGVGNALGIDQSNSNTLTAIPNPINGLIAEAENKKKKDEEEAAQLAVRLQNQIMAAFALEKSGSIAYKRGGTLLTSPLGLPDPVTGKTKNSAIGA